MRQSRLALLLLAGGLCSGCFQFSTVLSVKGDGSGTIDERLIFTQAAVAQLRQFAALAGGGPQQAFEPVTEQQARAAAATMGPGVTYVSSTPSTPRTGSVATFATRLRTSTSSASTKHLRALAASPSARGRNAACVLRANASGGRGRGSEGARATASLRSRRSRRPAGSWRFATGGSDGHAAADACGGQNLSRGRTRRVSGANEQSVCGRFARDPVDAPSMRSWMTIRSCRDCRRHAAWRTRRPS